MRAGDASPRDQKHWAVEFRVRFTALSSSNDDEVEAEEGVREEGALWTSQ